MERRNKQPGKSSKGNTKTEGIYMDFKDIIRENALRYLPAKTLHRSLTVCKDWKLQISGPFFVHNQSVSFKRMSGIFLQPPAGSPPSFLSLDQSAFGVPDPELKFLPEPVDVKSSSNGLLCCRGRCGERAYYVCNPVNQQWKKLPKPTQSHSLVAPIIAFEPSLLNFTAEYKIVSIFRSTDLEEAYEFEIYSSLQDSWKVSAEMFFSSRTLEFKKGLYVNGVAYWPMSNGKLMCFNVNRERAVEIYGSSACFDYGHSASKVGWTLGQVNGKLCISSMKDLSITVSVLQSIYANTMAMNSQFQNWRRQHFVLSSKDVKVEASDLPRVLLKWDDLIVVQVGSRVFSHNLTNRTTTALCNQAGFSTSCDVFPYVNSLVSLV